MNTVRLLFAALAVLVPSTCLAQVTWDFNASNALPNGWFTEGQGGRWRIGESQLGVGGGNVLRATVDPLPPGLAYGDEPEVRIDAYTPEFRFQDIDSAELSFNFSVDSIGGVLDSLLVTLHRVVAGVLDKGAGYALWQHIELDPESTPPLPLRVVDDGIGIVPPEHVDGQSVYRVRMRVFDGDLDKQSLLGVEVDNLSVTSAFLNVPFDYNRNGAVDAADYVLWRDTFGSTSERLADGDGDGTVDEDDYNLWRGHFGTAAGSAAGQTATHSSIVDSIPEPPTCTHLILVAICSAGSLVRRQSSGRRETPWRVHLGWDYPDR
jgi:hypothetical protein